MSPRDRPASEVLGNILRDLQEIVRCEIRLAKAELREQVTKAQSASVLVGIGALCSVLSAFFLLLTAVYALSRVMPNWAAALTVCAGLAVFAGVMLIVGLGRFRTVSSKPAAIPIASIEEHVEWATQPNK